MLGTLARGDVNLLKVLGVEELYPLFHRSVRRRNESHAEFSRALLTAGANDLRSKSLDQLYSFLGERNIGGSGLWTC